MDFSRNNPYSTATLMFVIDPASGIFQEIGVDTLNPKQEDVEVVWNQVVITVRGNFTSVTETVKRLQDAFKPPVH